MTAKAAPFGRWERAVAWRYLKARKKGAGVAFISVVAFVGIALAVMALIVILSIMNGFRSELLDRMLGFNGHAYVAGAQIAEPELTDAVRRIRAVPGVTRATPMVEGQSMLIGRGQMSGAVVRGIRPSDLRKIDLVMDSLKKGDRGSLQGFGDGEYGGDLIVLGERLAQGLAVAPGDSVTLVAPGGSTNAFGYGANQKDYIVAAVFSVGVSEYDQAFAYLPLEQAQLFFGKEGMIDVVEVSVANADQAPLMKKAIAQAAWPSAMVTDWTQRNQSFFNALQMERWMMRLVMGILVIITAFNIVSGLIMMVKNKARDVAILRTMGASRSSVLRVFLMVGASLGVAGTLLGLILGVLFCLNIAHIQHFIEAITGARLWDPAVYLLPHLPAKIDWREVLLITGFSTGVSLIATLPPSFWASRLDPVEALRFE